MICLNIKRQRFSKSPCPNYFAAKNCFVRTLNVLHRARALRAVRKVHADVFKNTICLADTGAMKAHLVSFVIQHLFDYLKQLQVIFYCDILVPTLALTCIDLHSKS